MSVFFFRGRTAATVAAGSSADYVAIEQLLTATGDGVGFQAEKIAEQSVTAVAQANGLQAGKQTALLLVQQPIEQENRCLQFVGRDLQAAGINGQGNGLGTTAGHDLIAALGHLDRGIEKLAVDFGPAQAVALDQMA